ncbi:MAG TPA: hypothetical protein VFH48_12500 [Chloroflexota bacterium]|nr:hypothetical protein [Chloroflexota bacterium]
MTAQRRIGVQMVAAFAVCSVLVLAAGPGAVAAAETSPSQTLATCSDPDSFGGAADVGDNQLAVERIAAPGPKLRLVARWSRWDGQDLAASAARELGRPIDWGSPRLVVRLREDSRLGVTLLTHEQLADVAEFSGSDLTGGEEAAVEVDPELLRPRSGGAVSVKLRVERPGLDLATCWAALPTAPTLDGASASGQSQELAATP